MNSRKEKIQLLKDLAAGHASINDIMPKTFKQRIGYVNGPNHFINGKPVDPAFFNTEKEKYESVNGKGELIFEYGPEEIV